jgi:hypothetical protein
MHTSRVTTWNLFRPGASIAVVLVVGLFVGTNKATADPIGPGFDYFHTPAGGASVDLGLEGGPISLEGVPLPNFNLGLTDTVVARKDPGPAEGATDTIDIELVALHLKSVAPVDFDPSPSGVMLGDLHITIDVSDQFFTGLTPHPDGSGLGPSLFNLPVVAPIPPSIGNMEMTHTVSGATMNACFGDAAACSGTVAGVGLGVPGGGIYASAFAVVPGGDPSNPADLLMPGMAAPPVLLASMGTYVHTDMNFAELGGIKLIAISHEGPHPGAQPTDDDVAPEPSSALLALLGLMGCGLVGNTRRRRA